MKLIFYEPHMCCPTGICGPSPDEKLIRLKETLDILKKKYPRLEVERYMITHHPQQFKSNRAVFELLSKKGRYVLPITVFDSEIIAIKDYPSLEAIESLIKRKKA
ncbi:MAG: arsenite efflux transporter metallochaperone ArsD [Bacillota bacterium]|nr:arsenite efflux transporter metallochaperone ArsD [Bacillota bacterium]